MPKDFQECVENGGSIRTKLIGADHYQPICVLDGQVFEGEVKKRKDSPKKKLRRKAKAPSRGHTPLRHEPLRHKPR